MGTPPPDPDLPVVRALQNGEESALNDLICKYKEPLFRFIYRSTGNEETARDLLQETFVRLYFGIQRFKPQAKFVTWLYSIAMNLCRDYARSKHHRQSYATESIDAGNMQYNETPSSKPGPDSELQSSERLRVIEKVIADLPNDLRNALLLFSIEGRSQQEAAELLSVSVKTVETRVYRARKILEKTLRGGRL